MPQETNNQKSTLSLRRPIIAGLLVLAGFAATLSAWASFAPLQSAAIAPGIVSVETLRKSVQHLEGGIVRRVMAREGARVSAGDVLVQLDTTRVKADYDIIRSRLLSAYARAARFESERAESDVVDWVSHPALDEFGTEDEIEKIKRRELEALQSRADELKSRRSMLFYQAQQARVEVAGLGQMIESLQAQRNILRDETKALDALVKKGLEGKSRLLLLRRQREELQTTVLSHQSSIARLEQRAQEIEHEIVYTEAQHQNSLVEGLQSVEVQITDWEEQLLTLRDVLQRTDIVAPISGFVVGLQALGVGAVIGPGEVLMEIVPQEEPLVIEARVNPLDIDVVHVGQRAEVRLSSLNQRNTLPSMGEVLTISADHFKDERTGASYFLARVTLNVKTNDDQTAPIVTAGMPVEGLILTGERTMANYIMQPLLESFNRAFRES